ncbi:MAG: aminoglycoside phosphotransferase family protein [Parafilimonas sp.]|nr:aminoglycoside phosphotransferase family protein [Parafilimonas sp.]
MLNVLNLYGLHEGDYTLENFGSGLINTTWLVIGKQQRYILQKINKEVFANPQLIDDNLQLIEDHIKKHNVPCTFVKPLQSHMGKTMVYYENEFYRLSPFIPSKTYTIVSDVNVAFEAAKQFGKFAKSLSELNADELYETIPHFHDLHLRYTQFLQAIKSGNEERKVQSEKLIESLQRHVIIVHKYDDIVHNPLFKLRVMHHDTKISNVLFDDNNNGIAVIDLDTVMPGYFISDVGDMLRTYLPPVSEEETDFGLIETRDEYFKAITEGYLSEMKHELKPEEINAFVYAGKFMIYMQALRFITDYLNYDVYYGAKYSLHNFNRAKNQLRLLECLVEKEEQYNSIVQQVL